MYNILNYLDMKVLVFSLKLRSEPSLYHIPFRKYGSSTKDNIFATRREKSMTSPGKSNAVTIFSDVRKFGLNFSGRSSLPL